MELGNFLKKAGKSIQHNAKAVGKIVENPVLAVAKSIVDTVNAIIDYADKKKMMREEKRRKDYQKLNRDIQENKQHIQKISEQNASNFVESIGDEAIEIDSASANEIRRISNELNNMQEAFILEAESIEDKIIYYVESAVNETIQEFEDVNTRDFDGATLNININYLKSCVMNIQNMVKGNIKNAVRRNLSIDNADCKAIFNLTNKNAKKSAMRDLQMKIYKEAVNSLWLIIRDTISIQNKGIFNQIENRLNDIELNVNESIRQLAEIESTKKLGEEEIKQKQIEFQNMIDISSWCLEKLNQEDLM